MKIRNPWDLYIYYVGKYAWRPFLAWVTKPLMKENKK